MARSKNKDMQIHFVSNDLPETLECLLALQEQAKRRILILGRGVPCDKPYKKYIDWQYKVLEKVLDDKQLKVNRIGLCHENDVNTNHFWLRFNAYLLKRFSHMHYNFKILDLPSSAFHPISMHIIDNFVFFGVKDELSDEQPGMRRGICILSDRISDWFTNIFNIYWRASKSLSARQVEEKALSLTGVSQNAKRDTSEFLSSLSRRQSLKEGCVRKKRILYFDDEAKKYIGNLKKYHGEAYNIEHYSGNRLTVNDLLAKLNEYKEKNNLPDLLLLDVYWPAGNLPERKLHSIKKKVEAQLKEIRHKIEEMRKTYSQGFAPVGIQWLKSIREKYKDLPIVLYTSKGPFLLKEDDWLSQAIECKAECVWKDNVKPQVEALTFLKAIEATPVLKNQIFVIMNFSKSRKRIFDVIKKVGDEIDCKACRADDPKISGKIPERIFEEIDRSRFVVADLTDARPNCYYEVGYAHARKKEVILTIHKDSEKPVDIRPNIFIEWTTPNDLESKLRTRLESLSVP